jgi:RNA polymerase sigma-70 factor, ECF subfamily
MDECEAIARLRRGDVRGLEVLVRKYQLEAVRVAFPITNDFGLAQEVVQDAFIKVYEHINQFDATRAFRPWFLRIVVNDALKCVQKQRRLVELEPDCGPQNGSNGHRSGESALQFEQQEFGGRYDDVEALEAVLGSLSPEHRTVLQLKYYLEMSDDEIAETVDIPPGTVKSRLHAAKDRLRCLLLRLNFKVVSQVHDEH